MLSELDRQLVGALQINPRISWKRLGTILAADATTLSRRWTRLLDERTVWSTFFEVPARSKVNPIKVALIEICCAPGCRDRIATRLSGERLIYSIDCTSGDRDLAVMVSGTSLLSLDEFVQTTIAVIPGVVKTRSHFLNTIYRDGPSWRIRGLSPDHVTDLGRSLPVRFPNTPPSPLHRELISALNPDPRRSIAALQQEVGRSASTVSRAVDTLMSVDWTSWRTDLAHEHLGWEAAVWIWFHADGPDLPQVVHTLGLMGQTRLTASVSGQANVAATFWLRELRELDLIERQLSARFPALRIIDRWFVPRVVKRLGHVLDSEGRHDRYVPIGTVVPQRP